MTDKLRDLYKRSLKEKWDQPIEYIKFFSFCPFCEEVIERDGSVGIDMEGDDCGDLCLIDRAICGHEDSLLCKIETYMSENDLRDFTKASFHLTEAGLNDQTLKDMIKNVQKLMKKHKRIKLRSKS